jgi:hypothetical protein
LARHEESSAANTAALPKVSPLMSDDLARCASIVLACGNVVVESILPWQSASEVKLISDKRTNQPRGAGVRTTDVT